MVTGELLREVSSKRWENIDNLISWKEFQYSQVFSEVHWSAGIVLPVLILWVGAGKFFSNIIDIIFWSVFVVIFAIGFIWAILKISKAHRLAEKDIEFLYRLRDGQINAKNPRKLKAKTS